MCFCLLSSNTTIEIIPNPNLIHSSSTQPFNKNKQNKKVSLHILKMVVTVKNILSYQSHLKTSGIKYSLEKISCN